jgi:PhnB protein
MFRGNEAQAIQEGAIMASKTTFIPEGYNTVTPYLIVDGAERALAFYKKAFGAKEVMRFDGPGGKVGHAEIRIGNSPVMLADEFPDMGAKGPQAFGGSPVSLHLYVEDVDALAKQAVAAGAKLTRPVADQFYGDRLGSVTDPFGHVWHIATHKEDLTPEEMKKRADKYMKEQVKA